jgi:hypothetical protein
LLKGNYASFGKGRLGGILRINIVGVIEKTGEDL